MDPGASSGKTAAQKAYEDEQAKQMSAYYATVNMLQTDAYRAAEAQQRMSLETLRVDTSRKTERVKAYKDKSLLVSAENVSKQELVDSMATRLADLSGELSRLTLVQARQLAARRTEDEKEAALRAVFEATMERAVARRNEVGYQVADPLEVQRAGFGTGPRSTPVHFCPGGESRDNALGSFSIRLARTTTFRELTTNAARYFGTAGEQMLLEDQHKSLWPLDVVVSREIARYRGEQVLRLVRRDVSDDRIPRSGLISRDLAGGGEEEDAELGTGTLLKMLGNEGGGGKADGAMGGGEGGGGGGDEEEDAEQQAAMEALAAMGDDETDSDDEANQRKEYEEPPINFRREAREGIMHMTFLVLLIVSTNLKRVIPEANDLYGSLETIFVEEEFGDFNEKAFEVRDR